MARLPPSSIHATMALVHLSQIATRSDCGWREIIVRGESRNRNVS